MGHGVKITRGILLACVALVVHAGAASAACGDARVQASEAPQSAIEQAFSEALAHDYYADSAEQAVHWRSLLDQAREQGQVGVRWLVRGQTRLANTLEYSDQADAAQIEAQKALDLIAENGLQDTALEAHALIVMVTILTDNKQLDLAATMAARALMLSERLYGPQSALASLAHNAAGTLAYARGRYIEADREFGKAARLAEACQAPDNPAVVNQLASHAGTLFMIGQIEDALDEARRAANWAAEHLPEDSPLQTLALGNLGAVLITTGRYAEAEKALQRVVDLEATYQGESWYYRSISMSNYATVLSKLGRVEEAEALWLSAVELRRKATIGRDPTSASFPMRYAADAAQERGDLVLALERRGEAVRMMDEAVADDDSERARTHLEQAVTLLLAGQPEAALAEAEPAIAVLRGQYGKDDSRFMAAEIAYARILAANGRAAEGFALARSDAERLQSRLLDAATSRGDLVRFGPAFATSFATMTELALMTGHEDEAFRYLQLANMSDVVVVTNEVAARAAAADPHTSAQIRDFQDRLHRRQALDRENSFALSAGDSARAAELASEIAANDAQIARLERQLERLDPRLRQFGRPSPVPLEVYRRSLGAGEVLIAPMLLPDAVLAVVVSREGLFWKRSDVPRHRARAWIRAVRESVDPDSVQAIRGTPAPFAYAAARELYRVLLPDALVSTFASAPDFVYFARGELAGLPLGLLIADDAGLAAAETDPTQVAWLIRDHSVRVAPSLKSVENRTSARRRPARFLGVGAPLFAPTAGPVDLSDLAWLPGATGELEDLARVFGNARSTVLIGVEASETALRALPLRDYSVLTFATHGLAGGERVGLIEPALVLAPSPPADYAAAEQAASGALHDGLLTASEIMQLRLDADWVILSACNTAGGATAGAPIFSGLASAFIQAGARSLLVSHWPVRDDIAERIVVAAVREREQAAQSPARALQAAQRALVEGRWGREAAEPRLWAAMVLVEP